MINARIHCMYCPDHETYFYIVLKDDNVYKLRWLTNKMYGTNNLHIRGCLDRDREIMTELSANNLKNKYHPLILQAPYVVFCLDEEIYHEVDINEQVKIENSDRLISIMELRALNPLALPTCKGSE